jgi:hypothetical protein
MYEDWSTKTPVITRGSMLAIFAVYVLSFFFALDKVSAAPRSAVQCSEEYSEEYSEECSEEYNKGCRGVRNVVRSVLQEKGLLASNSI